MVSNCFYLRTKQEKVRVKVFNKKIKNISTPIKTVFNPMSKNSRFNAMKYVLLPLAKNSTFMHNEWNQL